VWWVRRSVIVVLFTIACGLRIVTAESRWRYIRSFYGIIDLVALVTFYLTNGTRHQPLW